MNKLKKAFGRIAQGVIDRVIENGLMQEETAAEGERYITPGMGELIRKAGAEGCVLLKNDGVLPLVKGDKVAVFGRCQLDWFYVGYGSGGDVNAPYYVNLIDGLRNAGVPLCEDLLSVYSSWTKDEKHEADHGWWGHMTMCWHRYTRHGVARKDTEPRRAGGAIGQRAIRRCPLTRASQKRQQKKQRRPL